MTRDPRVLLVDGDELVRALMSKALLDRDVFCDSAVSARDALAQLAARPYALVLLHLEMENVESVLDAIRALSFERRPMILITAEVRSPKETIDTELVQVIIRRPLRVADVAGMVRACLDFVPKSDVNVS